MRFDVFVLTTRNSLQTRTNYLTPTHPCCMLNHTYVVLNTLNCFLSVNFLPNFFDRTAKEYIFCTHTNLSADISFISGLKWNDVLKSQTIVKKYHKCQWDCSRLKWKDAIKCIGAWIFIALLLFWMPENEWCYCWNRLTENCLPAEKKKQLILLNDETMKFSQIVQIICRCICINENNNSYFVDSF